MIYCWCVQVYMLLSLNPAHCSQRKVALRFSYRWPTLKVSVSFISPYRYIDSYTKVVCIWWGTKMSTFSVGAYLVICFHGDCGLMVQSISANSITLPEPVLLFRREPVCAVFLNIGSYRAFSYTTCVTWLIRRCGSEWRGLFGLSQSIRATPAVISDHVTCHRLSHQSSASLETRHDV